MDGGIIVITVPGAGCIFITVEIGTGYARTFDTLFAFVHADGVVINEDITIVVDVITEFHSSWMDGGIIVITVPGAGCVSVPIDIGTFPTSLIDVPVTVVIYTVTDFRNGVAMRASLEGCNPDFEGRHLVLEVIEVMEGNWTVAGTGFTLGSRRSLRSSCTC